MSKGNGNQNPAASISDPWDSAANATPPARFVWGVVEFDVWHCILQKGVGKVLFDPAVHDIGKRRTSVTITLVSLPDQSGNVRTYNRSMIAESDEWTRHVLPSITALDVTPRELNERYVKATFVPTGRKYTSKSDDGTEVTREATTIKFLELYADAEACQAAADAFYGNSGGDAEDNSVVPFLDPATGQPMDPAGNGSTNKEKATVFPFLKPMWDASGHSKDSFAAMIAANPLVAKHYTIDSPEVVAIMAAQHG